MKVKRMAAKNLDHGTLDCCECPADCCCRPAPPSFELCSRPAAVVRRSIHLFELKTLKWRTRVWQGAAGTDDQTMSGPLRTIFHLLLAGHITGMSTLVLVYVSGGVLCIVSVAGRAMKASVRYLLRRFD